MGGFEAKYRFTDRRDREKTARIISVSSDNPGKNMDYLYPADVFVCSRDSDRKVTALLIGPEHAGITIFSDSGESKREADVENGEPVSASEGESLVIWSAYSSRTIEIRYLGKVNDINKQAKPTIRKIA